MGAPLDFLEDGEVDDARGDFGFYQMYGTKRYGTLLRYSE